MNEVLLPSRQRGSNWSGVLVQVKGWQRSFHPVDEGLDGGDEVLDRGEAAAADRLPGDDAEEDLHHVQPRPGCRREVQRDSRVLLQPGRHVRVLVGGVVVRHDVQRRAGIGFRDLAQEPQEFLVPVPGVAGVGDLAGRYLQGGEQRGGAVPDVVMGLLLRIPGRTGSTGAVRSRAWTWDFSSTHNTTALSGGLR